mgnify:CR=1 FL=1
MQVWMDQGGTFTDVVRVNDTGLASVEKHLSDGACLLALAEGSPARRGTTVATNALLEGTGVPVLLITNKGFGDMHAIGDQTRQNLFARQIIRPPSLCVGTVEIDGRISADGTILAPAQISPQSIRAWVDKGVQAAAVVLLFGSLQPQEEEKIAQACIKMGISHVSMGHRVAPSRGFIRRLHTTLVDAATTPLLPKFPGLYMCSNGGLAKPGEGWSGHRAVFSGPAGGAIATETIAKKHRCSAAFGFDMGGTSTDVCQIRKTAVTTDEINVGGRTLRVPAIRLETVAAGGGSLLRVVGGVYSVGPASAGANPGPACYGRGGPATLTDVETVLGRLPLFPSVCGTNRDQPLDMKAAQLALRQLDPERPIEEIAFGFRRVAAETMAGAIRTLAASQGVAPSAHQLIAYGGAGPGHGCGVADQLGIDTILIPFHAGVLSAIGIGCAIPQDDIVVPVVQNDWTSALTRAHQQCTRNGTRTPRLAVRARGTSEVMEVSLQDPSPDGVQSAFEQAHLARFGFVQPRSQMEAVEIRLSVAHNMRPIHPQPPTLPKSDLPQIKSIRAWFGNWRDVPLMDARRANHTLGPAILTIPGSTIIVDPGWTADWDRDVVRLHRQKPGLPKLATHAHPVHTAVVGSRIMSVAQQMGERLRRLARSVSIRERLDFSCAVFDANGRLIANAPHIPVHLGAMGETVRDLIAHEVHRLAPHQAWATNDPWSGGSHLPDITVMSPVFVANNNRTTGEKPTPIAFVATRAHHVDVGGITPGSMPPHANSINQEGFILRRVLLLENGEIQHPPLSGSRQPEIVQADLEAQIAACTLGTKALLSLVEELGLEILTAQMDHLRTAARDAVQEVLLQHQGQHRAHDYLESGAKLDVRLTIENKSADFHVSAPQDEGNLNAPPAVARATLLYVFRTLLADNETGDWPLPLNEGALEPFRIHIPPNSLFSPSTNCAVAGGNVESSQRLVDVLMLALNAQAASQGTMNNLTVGTSRGSWYETIGGGSGAGPGFDGASAVQVHMTNTRATDPEELEVRFPIRLIRWSRRHNSGGDGRWKGGDGVTKEWEFLEDSEVNLLAGRRKSGAPGGQGGENGSPGIDECHRGSKWTGVPKQWRAKAGDRLRIHTPGGGGWGLPSRAISHGEDE